ncbi:MAG TPA: hypothetical protein VF680_00205 [Allosphingosinicella sp.]|jgi:hypothetical protein
MGMTRVARHALDLPVSNLKPCAGALHAVLLEVNERPGRDPVAFKVREKAKSAA